MPTTNDNDSDVDVSNRQNAPSHANKECYGGKNAREFSSFEKVGGEGGDRLMGKAKKGSK